MKKLITALTVATMLSISSGAYAHGSSEDLSVASVLSTAIVASSVAAPFLILDDLSKTSRPLKIEQVETKGDKTRVKCTDGKEKVELEVNSKVAQKAQVAPGKEINVSKQDMAYTLAVDKKVIGIVSNADDFKSNKVNK